MWGLEQTSPKLLALAGLVTLAACVITTEKSYFTTADFVRPKVFSGDWQSIPEGEAEDPARVRFEVHGKMWRALPLTANGDIDTSEEPIEFGLVALDPGKYILVQSDLPEGPYNHVGVDAQEARLTFYLFSGGASEEGEKAFAVLLARLGIERDSSFSYEARLAGNLSAQKIKALFTELLAHPDKYEGDAIVYVSLKG